MGGGGPGGVTAAGKQPTNFKSLKNQLVQFNTKLEC